MQRLDEVEQGIQENNEQKSLALPSLLNLPRTRSHEILIPADGDCLYTTVFLGYLLPVINAPEQFNSRLSRLLGSDSYNSEQIRKDLVKYVRNIEFLQGNDFKELIGKFKENVGLKDNRWGGQNEIKILSAHLQIVIQEVIVNPTSNEETPYVLSNRTQNFDSQETEQPDVIYILQATAHPNEVISTEEDLSLQLTKLESTSVPQDPQHYRLILSLQSSSLKHDTQPSFNRTSTPVSGQSEAPLTPTLPTIPELQLLNTIGAAGVMSQLFNNIFHPSSSKVPEIQVTDPSVIKQGLELVADQQDSPSSLEQQSDFEEYLPQGFPEYKSSDYQTVMNLMSRKVKRERPQYFTSPADESGRPPGFFDIGFRLLKEFTQGGALDVLLSHGQSIIKERKDMDESSKAAGLEALDGIANLVRFAGSDAAKDPKQSPLNKYVDPNDWDEAARLEQWLKSNPEHEDYDEHSRRFRELDKRIDSQRKRAASEGSGYMLSLINRMGSEYSEINESNLMTYLKKKWDTDKRKKFETYLLEEYDKLDLFESNQIRSFWEKLYRHQYGAICYAMVCESFIGEYQSSKVHQIVRQIWSVSHLDTIHVQPQEARTRMPAASVDGMYAPNFGYEMPRSDAYQNWITNPLVRASADIIMDAFHCAVDLGRALDIEIFLTRLRKHLFDEEDSAPSSHPYDKLMISFEFYLLEKVFHKLFVQEKNELVTEQLLRAAGSPNNLFEAAKQALEELKNFSVRAFKLRPTGGDATEEEGRRGFIFGIGFNGELFDSPSHSQKKVNEIWLSYSDAGRNNGGYLLLAFVQHFAKYPPVSLLNLIKRDSATFCANFEKYRALIRWHLTKEIDFYSTLDVRLSASSIAHGKRRCEILNGFLTQFNHNIPFDELTPTFQTWLLNTSNWYCIPYNIGIQIPEEMPKEEYVAQRLARELLLDALCRRSFSKEYPHLMSLLFLHWKHEIVKKCSLFLNGSEINLSIQAANTIKDLPENIANVIVRLIDELVWEVHPELRSVWQEEINKQFHEFIRDEVVPIDKELHKWNGKRRSLLKESAKLVDASKLAESINEAEKKCQQLELRIFTLQNLKHPLELSAELYPKFRESFFENREEWRCVEPVFARVLGHDRFFSIRLSKKTGTTNIKDSSLPGSPSLQIGNFPSQDVIPPCRERCRHNVLGHLYTGDMLSLQGADKLHLVRDTHGLGGLTDRFMSLASINELASKQPSQASLAGIIESRSDSPLNSNQQKEDKTHPDFETFKKKLGVPDNEPKPSREIDDLEFEALQAELDEESRDKIISPPKSP